MFTRYNLPGDFVMLRLNSSAMGNTSPSGKSHQWKAVAEGDHRMFLSVQDGAPSYVS